MGNCSKNMPRYINLTYPSETYECTPEDGKNTQSNWNNFSSTCIHKLTSCRPQEKCELGKRSNKRSCAAVGIVQLRLPFKKSLQSSYNVNHAVGCVICIIYVHCVEPGWSPMFTKKFDSAGNVVVQNSRYDKLLERVAGDEELKLIIRPD